MEYPKHTRNLNVYCKVKPPSQNEIYGAGVTAVESCAVDKRSRSSERTSLKKAPPKNSSLAADFHYNFFVCDSQNATKVIHLENPIKRKLLEEDVHKEDDFYRLSASILENSTIYEFNQAFSSNSSIIALYNATTKPLVYELLQGRSCAVFLYGSAHSGKQYLLRGEETKEQGLVIKALEDLLGLLELSQEAQQQQNTREPAPQKRYEIGCSIYCVYKSLVSNLVAGPETRGSGGRTNPIDDDMLVSSMSSFRHLYRRAMNNLKELANENNTGDFSGKCHVVISLKLRKTSSNSINEERMQETCLSFVRLADVDHVKENPTIGESMELLREYLLYCSGSAKSQQYNNSMLFREDSLIKNLMLACGTKPLISFICTLPPSTAYSKMAGTGLSFAASLYKECKAPVSSTITRSYSAIRREEAVRYPAERSSENPYQLKAAKMSKRPATARRSEDLTVTRRGEAGKAKIRERPGLYSNTGVNQTDEAYSYGFSKDSSETSESAFSSNQRALKDTRKSKDTKSKPSAIRTSSTKLLLAEGKTLEKKSKTSSKSKSSRLIKERVKDYDDSEVEDLRREVRHLQSQVEHDKFEIDRLNDRLRDLEDELGLKSDTVANLGKELREAHSQLERSNADLQNMQDQLATSRKKEETAARTNDELAETIENLQHKLSNKISQYEKDNYVLAEKNARLLESLDKLKRENISLQGACQTERTLNAQEAEQIREYERKNLAMSEELTRCEKFIQTLREDFEQQEDLISQYKQKFAEQNTVIRELEEARRHENQDRVPLAKQVEELTRALKYQEEKTEAVMRAHEVDKAMLMDEQRDDKARQRDIIRKEQEHEEQLKILERQIAMLKQERDKLRYGGEELKDTKNEMRKLYEEIEALQQKNDEEEQKRNVKLKELDDENEELSEEVRDLRARYDLLQVEKEELNAENNEKMFLLGNLDKQLDRVQNQQLDEREMLEGRLRQSTNEITRLKRENDECKDQLRSLQIKLEDIERSREDYIEKYTQCKKDNKVLRTNLNEIDWKMKSLIDHNPYQERSHVI